MDEKKINSSIEFINTIEENSLFVLKGTHTPYHDCLGNISKKKDSHYNFKIQNTFREYLDMRDIPDVILETSKYNLSVNKIFINNIDNNDSKGEIYQFSVMSLQEEEKKYFRLAIKRKDNNQVPLHHFFEYNYPFQINTFKSREQLKLEINNNAFNFYFITYQDIKYIFIDSIQKLSYTEFYRSIYSILISFGFITGKLPMDEGYFFAYDNTDYNNFVHARYSTLIGSSSSIYNPIYTNAFSYISDNPTKARNLNKQLKGIKEKEFSNLCTKAYDSPELSSVMYLLLEASKGSLQMMAGCYSMCLETLTHIIASDNEDKLNPIKDKRMAKKIKDDLLSVINNNKDKLGDGYEILRNKIGNINQATNRDKLIKPFHLLGIELTIDDKECIDKRNYFLHGRMPDIEMGKIIDDKEFGKIFHTTLKLNILISALILKLIGFSGKILNHTQIHNSITKINLYEEIYRDI